MPGGEATPEAQARTIVSNTAYRAAAELGSKLATVALWVLVARELGSEAFGTLTYAFAVAALATALGNFGQERILVREVARDARRLDDYFWSTLAQRVLLALAALAATIAGGVALGADSRTLVVTALLGISFTGDLLVSTCFAAFQAFERLSVVPLVLVPQRIVLAIVGISAVLLGASVVVVAAIYAAVGLLAFPVALAFLARRVAAPARRLQLSTWPALMRAAFPVGIGLVLATVLYRVNVVVLGRFEPHAVVGDYGAAHRLFESTTFLSWSVGAAVFPVFARLGVLTVPSLADVLERSLKLLLALTLPFAVGAAVVASPVLQTLFGADYEDGASALALLAPALAAYPVVYVSAQLLIARDRERFLALMYGAAAVASLAVSLALVPFLSLDGAALGLTVPELALAAVLLWAAVRTTGPIDWVRTASGPLAAAAVEAVVLLALDARPLLTIVAAGLAYMGVLAAVEQLAYPRDARLVWQMLRRA